MNCPERYRVFQRSVLVLILALTGCAVNAPEEPPTAPAPLQCDQPPPPVCPPAEPAPALVCPEPVVCPAVPECPKPAPSRRMFDDKLILGAVEVFAVQPGAMRLEARVDTGATTSSLHATNVVVFERDGERWVRFDADTGAGKAPVALELPLVRQVRIKGEADSSDQRPVVTIEVGIDGIERRIEATLNDRSNYEYPLLVGRNFLRDTAVVDVERSYLFGKP